MIDFLVNDNNIILHYTPDSGSDWESKVLEERNYIVLKKTFHFETADLELLNNRTKERFPTEDFGEATPSYFVFATLDGEYYKIKKGILIDKVDIYIHKSVQPEVGYFVADSNVSIFKVIADISSKDFFLEGDAPTAIPLNVFESILKFFPNSYERRKYIEARISSILKNYLDDIKDSEKGYQKYLNKRLSKKGSNLTKIFQESELIKYQTIFEKLNEMLRDEVQYNEHQWQEEILQIILLLYPKYIFAFKEVPILASLSDGIKEKYVDFLLVDSGGNVDIIEIKKPFEHTIMTEGQYRGNYIPLRELSGTIMQIEKYIYYLNRWSENGEKYLTSKYINELPLNFKIKITNPNGVIIMGREHNLTVEQKQDFEIVKRKYKHIVDIITYDNLLERLSLTITQIKKI